MSSRPEQPGNDKERKHKPAVPSPTAPPAAQRPATPHAPAVGAVILAAGSSRRAGRLNKLLHLIDGEPMIRKVVRTAVAAGVRPCLVVLGHEAERVREALRELPVEFALNEAHAEGMGTSIARGIAEIAATKAEAAFIMLGDMPQVRVDDLERLRAAHRRGPQDLIVAPEAGEGEARRLGNPVLWPRRYFEALRQLRGDQGAKRIIKSAPESVRRVWIDHPGVLLDIDTPQRT